MERLMNVAVCLAVLAGASVVAQPPLQPTQADLERSKAELGAALYENEQLKRQLSDSGTSDGFAIIFGLGAGVGIVAAGESYGKYLKPKTKRGKQGAVLLAAALWTSGCFISQLHNHEAMRHPANAAMTALFYASPAIFFGGVGFWWFWPERHGKVERL